MSKRHRSKFVETHRPERKHLYHVNAYVSISKDNNYNGLEQFKYVLNLWVSNNVKKYKAS